jgi:RNA polymerase sigma-70 factor (ECF subfamily)
MPPPPHATVSSGPDRTLLAGLAQGRDDAFGELVDRYSARMFRVAVSVLGRGRASDAEDAVQDVLVALVSAGESLTQVTNLTAYLMTAVQRAAIRRSQRAARLPGTGLDVEVADAMHAANADAAGDGPDADLSSALDRALATLPADQRDVVALKIDGGLTFAEIAAALELSPNTVASRYRYALEKIRSRLEDTGHAR